MIVEAVNVYTGKKVGIKEARTGQSFVCPYCGVDVYPVHKSNTQFFRCFEGGKHTHYLCEQLDKSNRVYDPTVTNAELLFTNLFRPVKESPSSGPTPGPTPGEEEPETDGPGLGSGEEEGGGDDENGETEREKEPDDGEDDPPEPEILPCKSLSQLWKAGIDKFGPSERMGSGVRSDIFLWYKDFVTFFARHEDLGERVLAVRPLWPVNRAKAILFASFSNIRGTKEYKRKYFVLEFQERKEYNKACKKLFVRNTDMAGTNRTAAKYNMVLVAGDWTELDEEEYAAFSVKSGEHIYGVQRSPFYSKNQIYPLPQYKIKA